jgi:phenylacetate-coenzyme A ligase PaaK-like adenylate-forming protein
VGLKKRLKELLESMGARNPAILSTFGFTEARVAWAECPVENSVSVSTGYHLYPDFEIFEIIDSKTGKPVGDGESGEIVYTALDWRGSVVIRYRTGDFAKGGITWKTCPACGRKVPRLSSDITRLSDHSELNLSKVKGTLVDFNEFYQILSGLDGVVEWQVEITKKDLDPNELDEIHIYLATSGNVDQERLAEKIQETVHASMEITVGDIKFVTPEVLTARLGVDDRPKEMRIVDRRPELERKEAGG